MRSLISIYFLFALASIGQAFGSINSINSIDDLENDFALKLNQMLNLVEAKKNVDLKASQTNYRSELQKQKRDLHDAIDKLEEKYKDEDIASLWKRFNEESFIKDEYLQKKLELNKSFIEAQQEIELAALSKQKEFYLNYEYAISLKNTSFDKKLSCVFVKKAHLKLTEVSAKIDSLDKKFAKELEEKNKYAIKDMLLWKKRSLEKILAKSVDRNAPEVLDIQFSANQQIQVAKDELGNRSYQFRGPARGIASVVDDVESEDGLADLLKEYCD